MTLPEVGTTLVIGCGNLLRGDDAVGPVTVRRLLERGLPDGVEAVDGGTSGIDVALRMRGAARVVIVDAASTGSEPGTLHRLDGSDVESLPPPDQLNLHGLRWDHALTYGRWLLQDEYPAEVVVYLVEGRRFGLGEPLSDAVESAVERLVELLLVDELAEPEG